MYLDLIMFRYLLWKNITEKYCKKYKSTKNLFFIIIIYFNQYTPINVYLKKYFFCLKN